MAKHFENGVALVTGAGSGIGRATATSFARDGCIRLALGDISIAGLEETGKILKGQYPNAQVELIQTDVTSEVSVEALYDRAIQKFDRIDYVANVAGHATTHAPVTEQEESEYDKTLAINLRGVFLSQRAALRQMMKQDFLPNTEQRGVIINVGSIASNIVMPGLAPYTASKAAVLALTKSDALDYGPHKIRLVCVGPGNTLTPMLKAAASEEYMRAFAASTPYRRMAEPEEIANSIVWLCSPMAGYITGTFFPIDGGLNLWTG